MQPRYTLKIAVIGDYAVGKTSLIQQFIQKSFRKDYRPTLGADISLYDLELTRKDQQLCQIRLMLWDVAGQFQWKQVRKRYYEGTHGILLVYDITRAPTFYNIEGKWMEELQEYCYIKNKPKPPIILVGNKLDLENIAKIDQAKNEKMKLKHENIIQAIQTSAKTGTNVIEAFHNLSEHLINR